MDPLELLARDPLTPEDLARAPVETDDFECGGEGVVSRPGVLPAAFAAVLSYGSPARKCHLLPGQQLTEKLSVPFFR